ncbi:DUF6686 family protein [Carboxylicivirga linearis]|uniref:HNH endonuclease n=1 Tax=Carboxylicivirga linearis TaxID=1628157 RepID=A0ABS5JZX5_9BACT|nr:DUF6686 family protein [Carboxylicivirga linearis]MBS2100447.1 hypothetical protein [Carboxylicivirga linearis]
MENIISQTSNGKVFICNKCDKIHIEFYHFLFSFDEEAYAFFKDNIAQVDGAYYENVNAGLNYRRKIVVPLGHRNVSMLLNQKELNELKLLLSTRCYLSAINCFLSVKEIGMPIAAN